MDHSPVDCPNRPHAVRAMEHCGYEVPKPQEKEEVDIEDLVRSIQLNEEVDPTVYDDEDPGISNFLSFLMNERTLQKTEPPQEVQCSPAVRRISSETSFINKKQIIKENKTQ